MSLKVLGFGMIAVLLGLLLLTQWLNPKAKQKAQKEVKYVELLNGLSSFESPETQEILDLCQQLYGPMDSDECHQKVFSDWKAIRGEASLL